MSRLNPVRSPKPLPFEFVAVSEGAREPVEFYDGADGRLEVPKRRLRAIHQPSFEIDRVGVDLVEKLIEPGEYRPDDVRKRLDQGRLYAPDAVDSRTNQDGTIGANGGRFVRGRR